MRKNFGVKTWLYPMPVLIIGSYDENGVPNAMNAAWGGIHDTNQIGVCIDPGHKTAANIRLHREFTVSIGTAAYIAACDYVGLVSGNQEPDKLRKAGFHSRKADFVNAPVIEELPMTLECRLISCDPQTGCTVGEIVNISADEKILDENGKILPEKLEAVCFDPIHHVYLKLGPVAARAFQVGLQLGK